MTDRLAAVSSVQLCSVGVGEDALRPRLFDAPLAGVYPVTMAEANALLVAWKHKLGPCERPFGQEGYVLEAKGVPVAVAVSASIVNGPVRNEDSSISYERDQVVELARLAAANPWANRVMLRLYREVCAQLWPHWSVEAIVSYRHRGLHKTEDNLYRFDGWSLWRSGVAGSRGSGTWTKTRDADAAVVGKKDLWGWEF